ncbi:hypothetical protein ABFS82_05G067700 [Erythranthe guttata]
MAQKRTKMAQTTTNLIDLKPCRFDWKVVVRVMRLWKVPSKSNPNEMISIDMVLIDNKGDKIHASIKRNHLKKFELIVNEGNTYIFQNFMVAPSDPRFRSTRHTHKIVFISTTRVTDFLAENIPVVTFNFTDFRDIINNGDDTWLIDVIGHVIERDALRELNKNGRSHKLLEVGLQDLSGNKLKCALWDKYAEELSTHLINDKPDSPIIIILQLCMVKSFNGKNSISNAFHSSKLLINENLEEHREYREKLMMQAGTFSQSISQISTHRSVGISDDLLQTEHMTISDLMDCTSERSVALLAKVVEIDCESKWWYPSCSTCFRKVDRNGVQFYCEKCIDNVPAIPRNRIQVLVFDVTGSISLVMFDKVVTEIIGKKAADILGDLGKSFLGLFQ